MLLARHDRLDYFGEATRVALYDLQHVLVSGSVREQFLEESLTCAVLGALLVGLLGPAKDLRTIAQLVLVPEDYGDKLDRVLSLPVRARDEAVQAELLLDHVEGAQRSSTVCDRLLGNQQLRIVDVRIGAVLDLHQLLLAEELRLRAHGPLEVCVVLVQLHQLFVTHVV